jgi:hypothetical protein
MSRRNGLMLALVTLALLVRIAIPQGWMPDASDGAVRISLCSGEGAVAAWIGKDGKIHKVDPAKGDHKDAPCAFTGLAMAGDAAQQTVAAITPIASDGLQRPFPAAIRVGQGLAAPPPPKTGPPLI